MATRLWTSGPNRPCADACVAASCSVTLQASLSWGTTLAERFFMHGHAASVVKSIELTACSSCANLLLLLHTPLVLKKCF